MTKLLFFTVGKFGNNKFSASDKNSLRGVITVKHEGLSADIDIVVGMEPYVLMDFEDKKRCIRKYNFCERLLDASCWFFR